MKWNLITANPLEWELQNVKLLADLTPHFGMPETKYYQWLWTTGVMQVFHAVYNSFITIHPVIKSFSIS